MTDPPTTPPRWYGDERGLPPCRDAEHRHSGPCEMWTRPPVPWADDRQITVTLGRGDYPFEVTHRHNPTGCVVSAQGGDLGALQALCTTELTRMIIKHLRDDAADQFRRSDNIPLGRDAHATGAVTRVGDLRERAQRLLDAADTIEKEVRA